MVISKLITGGKHTDQRGTVYYNNDFDVSQVKRMYIIENADSTVVRAWQGHRIEQRWFSAIRGTISIKLIKIDNWEAPSKNLPVETFTLNSDQFIILHIPKGYISSIQALEKNSRLLVMADTFLGETNDEYRLPADYFEK